MVQLLDVWAIRQDEQAVSEPKLTEETSQ